MTWQDIGMAVLGTLCVLTVVVFFAAMAMPMTPPSGHTIEDEKRILRKYREHDLASFRQAQGLRKSGKQESRKKQ